jgi:hypothetical protein
LSQRGTLAAALTLLLCSPAGAQKFQPDDPLREDPDRIPVPMPAAVELSTTYDVLENTFRHRPSGTVPRAVNVNTLGEVPDSSWFTNRGEMTIADFGRGPGSGRGPDEGGAWTVIAGKSHGITPGFTIQDPRGDVYFIKVDPLEHPHLSTSADVVGARFFHAFGYHVPANDLVLFRREQLRVAAGAQVSVKGSKKRAMTGADLDQILARAARLSDGRVRAVASLRLAGEPVGPFEFHGTRPDDPNDIFPHEHRRELRGLRVFSAWLNHDDSRSLNTLDTYVREGNAGWVRHHLIDFSSIMGSGSDSERRIAPQNPRAGNEYVVDWGPTFRSLLTLGIWDRPWRKVKYPEHPEVGRFEAAFYRPERWKGEYPNPAFERMLPEDAFWAARILARFSDEAIAAIVRAGEYDDAAGERYLVETLVKRRDKTIAHYYRRLNPLGDFRLTGATDAARLEFRNLGEAAGLGRADAYEYQWFAFDNSSGRLEPLGAGSVATRAELPLPAERPEHLMARIRTRSATEPLWRKTVEIYVRTGSGGDVVGIEREN